MANFEVSLPSIPGKSIKFKIQDIKSSAFGTQRTRFQQNKCWLTKKFVQSFNNFYPPKTQQDTLTDTSTSLHISRISHQKSPQFRQLVPDNKKFLVSIYNQLQTQQKDKISKSLNPTSKIKSRGYSFAKYGSISTHSNLGKQSLTGEEKQDKITDNYHFTFTKIHDKSLKKNKKQKLSATFLNQTRQHFDHRIATAIIPGPGTYYSQKPTIIPKKSNKKSQTFSDSKTTFPNQIYLKNLIVKVLEQNKQIKSSQKQQQIKQFIKSNYMFIQDDRDRFGQQIFPIAPKTNNPGPGYYQPNDTLQQRIKKVILVEQQRKLLKQWFNN